MTSPFHSLRALAMTALPVLLASCTSSLELDRFRKDETSSIDTAIAVNYFDVRFATRGMVSHIGEHFEVRVVDKQNRLQAKAVYDDITGADFSLHLARIVPKQNAPYRLDYWADHNGTAKYDGIEGGINEKDHAWRRVLAGPLPEDMRLSNGRYELDFVHDTAFVDIATDLDGNKIAVADTLLPFQLQLSGGDAFKDKRVDVRVVDKVAGRMVAMYRQGRARGSMTAKVTGVLDEETAYDVSIYVDLNENGKYDPADPSWKLDIVSGSDGLFARIDLGAEARAPIETGEQ